MGLWSRADAAVPSPAAKASEYGCALYDSAEDLCADETIDAIKRVHDGIAGGDLDRRRSRSIEVDALAARANSLEDAIVRKVEEVQRMRDDVFGVSRKIEL